MIIMTWACIFALYFISFFLPFVLLMILHEQHYKSNQTLLVLLCLSKQHVLATFFYVCLPLQLEFPYRSKIQALDDPLLHHLRTRMNPLSNALPTILQRLIHSLENLELQVDNEDYQRDHTGTDLAFANLYLCIQTLLHQLQPATTFRSNQYANRLL
jgi:hypothetical protein